MNPETKQPQMPKHWARFHEGEEVFLKGLWFKVSRVTKKVMILRPIDFKGKVMDG